MSDKVVKTDEEWQKQSTEEQYRVARHHGTERAGSARALPRRACLARAQPIDVFVLAGWRADLAPGRTGLSGRGAGVYTEVVYLQPKVRAVSRLPPGDIRHVLTTVGREVSDG